MLFDATYHFYRPCHCYICLAFHCNSYPRWFSVSFVRVVSFIHNFFWVSIDCLSYLSWVVIHCQLLPFPFFSVFIHFFWSFFSFITAEFSSMFFFSGKVNFHSFPVSSVFLVFAVPLLFYNAFFSFLIWLGMDQDHTSQRATCNGFLRRRGADKTYGIKLVWGKLFFPLIHIVIIISFILLFRCYILEAKKKDKLDTCYILFCLILRNQHVHKFIYC